MEASTPAAGRSGDFDDIARTEAEWIAQRRAASGLGTEGDSVGLAFSGGGIRSATFNLGVLEALEAAGLMRHVDYLSSVSGGGYVAACYSWLRASLPANPVRPFDSPLRDGGRVAGWVRSHGRFLVAARGYSLWTLFGSILAATFLNLLVLAPVVVLAVYLMTLGWLPLAWPEWLSERLGGLQNHHGYLFLLGAAAVCLALFPLVAILFGFVAGIEQLGGSRMINRLRLLMGRLLGGGFALLALGSIPVVHALGEKLGARFDSTFMHGLGHHLPYLGPLVSGLMAVLGGGKGRSIWRLQLGLLGLSLVVYGLLVFTYHLAVHRDIVEQPWFAAAMLLSLLMAVACNINRISMHGYYRSRLTETYLPPLVAAAGADPGQFAMDRIDPRTGAPFHLVNTTLNTTSSPDEKRHGREGASFFFSPTHFGSSATGFASTRDTLDGAMPLSTAITISGAAVDPDTSVTSGRAVSALMALLNVRLGYWAANPAMRNRTRWPLPWWWILIGREMLGIGLDERRARIHLSDGGHFENLGIYELVRRRVRMIIVTDAGADPDLTLADLGRAIERVRVDFGAQVELDASALVEQHASGRVTRPYLLGTVRYADGSMGRIAYIKTMQLACATADLYAYARAFPAFPDQPTSNQFFGEAEFEAYRVLGRETIALMLGDGAPADIAQWFSQLDATAT